MTMTLISTAVVGSGGAASIEFTSIPQDADDLLLLISARADSVAILLNLNGSSSDFSGRHLTGTGSSAFSTTETTQIGYMSDNLKTANTFGNASAYITNYTSSVAKSISTDSVQENNDTSSLQSIHATTWNNTNAITSLSLSSTSGNFSEHTTASLYKITKA